MTYGTMTAYYSWYNEFGGTIGIQGTAPNITTAYTTGDLGALGDNGGPTQTMATSEAAPAVGNGAYAYYNSLDGYYFQGNDMDYYKLDDHSFFTPSDPATDKITTDQRGEVRGDTPTIGAYDYVATPTLTTTSVTTYGSTNATMGGNISDDGGATVSERGVVYSVTATNSNPEIGGTGVTKDDNGSGTGSFSESISGLSAGTAYSVKAYAINSAGTSYGEVKTFTTLISPGNALDFDGAMIMFPSLIQEPEFWVATA